MRNWLGETNWSTRRKNRFMNNSRRKKSGSDFSGKHLWQARGLAPSHNAKLGRFTIWPKWLQIARYSCSVRMIRASGKARRICSSASMPKFV